MDKKLVDCAYCGMPMVRADAHEICFFEHIFFTCSDRCKRIWKAVLIGRQNCEESIYK